MKFLPLAVGLLFLQTSLISGLRAADAPTPAELKLRESIRALTLQVRAADNEKATLQATQAEAEAKATALTEEMEKLQKKVAADKTANDLASATAEAKFIEKDTELTATQKQLAEWKKAHAEVTAQFKKAVEIGNTKEAARVIVLDRQVADQKSKNSAMYKLGSEILSRYEKFGLGDVITRKEPFIGTTKVKFDTLIQDFTDGLADQKIKP